MGQHAHALTGSIDLLGFLLLGLLGSAAHCVAMCAPFVLFVSARYASPAASRSMPVAQAWYTAGRLTTYALLGASAGVIGAAFESAGAFIGLQRSAAAIGGAALIVSAMLSLSGLRQGAGPHAAWLLAITNRLRTRVPGHPFFTGVFLGFLPCGLIYTAVVAAVALGSPWRGALALAAFGVGTAPALLGVAFAERWLVRQRPFMNRASQVFILLMGAWFLWRGLVA